MKKGILYFVFIWGIMFFTSCSGDELLVKDTGERFIDAILKNDLTTAKTLVTPETSKKWGDATIFIEEILTPELKENLQKLESRVSDVKVNGKEAEAKLVVGIPAELVGEVTILHFQKRGEIWLIHEPGILVKDVLRDEKVILEVAPN